MKKKLLAILITLSMVVCAMTATAFAETTGVSYMKWDDDQKMLVSDTCNSYTKVTAGDTTWAASGGNNGWYIVEGEITISHTVTITGDVKLILCDGCSLTVKGENGTDGEPFEEPITEGNDAIKGTGNLTIYGQSNCTGTLMAKGGKGGSDGDNGKSGGKGFNVDGAVIINGGTVNACGGQGGNGECFENDEEIDEGIFITTHDSQAGCGENGIFGNTVTVNGGTVNAYGGNGGDNHGSSAQGLQADSSITINGGTVYAEAGKGSAGMRTKNGNTGTITINGGEVTARGSKDDNGGNGIETGKLTVGSNIKIVGGSKDDLTNGNLNSMTASEVRNSCYYVHTVLTAPIFDDRFGGTGLTKDSYTKDAVPTQDCHAKTQGYKFAGWSTAIDDVGNIIIGEPEGGKTYYAVWKKNDKTVITQPIDLSDPSGNMSGDGWSWNNHDRVMTLTGVTIDVESSNEYRAITLPTGSKLVLNGNNTIILRNMAESAEQNAVAVKCAGSLDISGTGTLDVKSDSSKGKAWGIEARTGLTYASATVNVASKNDAIYVVSEGSEDCTMTVNSGKITTAVTEAEDSGNNGITVKKGTFTLKDGEIETSGGSHGIVAGDNSNHYIGKIVIEKGTVNASAAGAGLWSYGDTEIIGGTVTATATGTNGNDYGINSQAGDIAITGGTVTVTGDEYGIRSKIGNITISGDDTVVIAKGGTSAYYIDSGKTLTADARSITAKSDVDGTGNPVYVYQDDSGTVTSDLSGAKYVKIEPLITLYFGQCGVEGKSNLYHIFTNADRSSQYDKGFGTSSSWDVTWSDRAQLNLRNCDFDYNLEIDTPTAVNGKLTAKDITFGTNGSIKLIDGDVLHDASGTATSYYGDTLYLSKPESGSYGLYADDNNKFEYAVTAVASGAEETSDDNKYAVAKINSNLNKKIVFKKVSTTGYIAVLRATGNVSVNGFDAGENVLTIQKGESGELTANGDIKADKIYVSDMTVNMADGKFVEASNKTSNELNILDGATVRIKKGSIDFEKGSVNIGGNNTSVTIEKNNDGEAAEFGIRAHTINVNKATLTINDVVTGINMYDPTAHDDDGATLNLTNGARVTVSASGVGIQGTAGEGGYYYNNITVADTSDITVQGGTKAVASAILSPLPDGKLVRSADDKQVTFTVNQDANYTTDYYYTGTTNVAKALKLADITATVASDITNGTLTISDNGAGASETVTITATPDEGYELDEITVKDKDDNDITATALNGTTITMPDADKLPITVSATFKIKQEPTPTPATQYTVTFDNQGHGVVPQSQAIEEGGKVSDPGSLEAEGFIFGGWFTDKECTDAWDFDNDTVTKNITLYAKWTEKTAIEDCEIVLSNEVYVFNNKVQIPNVTLTDPSGNILEEDRDYTFELEDSKNVGTYAVTVNGIGAYKGSGQASYKINPASKAIKKVNAGKKKLTVKWKKSSKTYRAQTTGYQIRYSTSKSFKKYKTKKVSRNAASKTIKNLKAHKKYYVKMRRYKVVDGQKYYSTWSKVKIKKTK